MYLFVHKEQYLYLQKYQKRQQIQKPHKNNPSKQTTITTYFTPTQSPHHQSPVQPSKPLSMITKEFPLRLNLYKTFFQGSSPHPPADTPAPGLPTCPRNITWKQVPLMNYFRVQQNMAQRPSPIPPPPVTQPKKSCSVRQALIQYRKPRKPLHKITRYTISLPTYDLFDSWGHSLESIDPNHTFRVFLQNPNGLAIT
jgi:hypothetical protein